MLSLNVRQVCFTAGHRCNPATILKRAALLGCLLALPLAARAEDLAIPPGQERVIASMLGSGMTLPGGCRLVDAGAEYTMIQATYTCADGPVAVELTHVDKATAASSQTAKFAISLRGGILAPGFAPGLVALVRAREHSFQWKIPSSDHEGIVDDDDASSD